MSVHELSIAELNAGLAAGEYSSVELTQHFLDRIGEVDGALNSYITQTPAGALAAAEAADRARAEGESRPLLGIPIAHKDIFLTEGVRTSAGSRMLDNFVAPFDATVVSNLTAAGVVSLGKTNMDEFAMGSSNETSYYGPCRNPWDTDRVPGGSSGGSAAAVAARLCVAATGTDTGGSIRQPAAMCGITGLKPTYGRVSRWGIVAYASSLDQAGPMARSAEDAALLLQEMAGFDPRDSTSIDAPVPDYVDEIRQPIAGMKLGVVREFTRDLAPAVAAGVETFLTEARRLGAEVREVSLPHVSHSIPAYYVIAPAECSANLSRYDGVRFGYRCDDPQDIEDLFRRSRSEAFGREVKRRVLTGAFALSAGYYDAYYKKAQQIRRLIKNDFVDAFDTCDVLIGATCPSAAFGIGAKSEDQLEMYQQDIFTIACNLAGVPALSLPVGLDEGLPVGVQLIGNYLRESDVLRLAHQFQRVTDHHKQVPPA